MGLSSIADGLSLAKLSGTTRSMLIFAFVGIWVCSFVENSSPLGCVAGMQTHTRFRNSSILIPPFLSNILILRNLRSFLYSDLGPPCKWICSFCDLWAGNAFCALSSCMVRSILLFSPLNLAGGLRPCPGLAGIWNVAFWRCVLAFWRSQAFHIFVSQ